MQVVAGPANARRRGIRQGVAPARRQKQQNVGVLKGQARRSRGGRPPGSNATGGPRVGLFDAVNNPVRSSRPRERPSPGGRSLIFEEFVSDVLGYTVFTATSFPVQPGLQAMFSWLANQAIMYQEYRFRRITFHYKTESANSVGGKILFAFNPDAGDAAPATKQEALEYQEKAGDVPWCPFDLTLGMREALGERRYIRGGTLAANLDIKTYDLGNLWVCSTGVSSDATIIGELWVSYEIDLIRPTLSNQLFSSIGSKLITAGAGVADGSHFGTVGTLTSGGLDVTAAGNVLTFNRVGRYIINGYDTGTGMLTSYVPAYVQNNCTATNLYGISNAAANVGTQAAWAATVVVTLRGATLTVDTSTQTATLTASLLYISLYSA